MGKTIVVIGGGASGLMAAITAARAGARVTILEQNGKLGKKILSTGNGRCNLTNLKQDLKCYRCDQPEFIQCGLPRFSVDKTLDFFQELGIFFKNRNGYIYPRTNQASSVVNALEIEARSLKIKCKTQEEVVGIEKTPVGFSVKTNTWHYDCDSVILACGSKASAVEGSTGSGYVLAKQLGHRIIKPLPALVGLKGSGNYFAKWAGVRTDAAVTLMIDDIKQISDTGEVQLTDYGISGIPVFQISRYAARAIENGSSVKVEIDFLPEMDEDKIRSYFEHKRQYDDSRTIKDILVGLFPVKLIDVLYKKQMDIDKLVNRIKHFMVPIKETMDFSHAQICTGGIACEEIDANTMESKLHRGVYFCGELIDVDGACGGYNLQWAWTSGYIAGISASKELL